MAFPQDTDDLLMELFIDGQWVNITSSVRGETGVQLARGGQNETSESHTSVNYTLTNTNGDFSNRYPTSPYYGKLNKNTKGRFSALASDILTENFNRVQANTWAGGSFPWTITTASGAIDADFDINGTHGLQIQSTANNIHYSSTAGGSPDQRVRATFKLSAGTLTGAGATVFVMARFTDISNWYAARVNYTTGGDITLSIAKTVAGIGSLVSDLQTTHSGYTGLFDDYEFTAELLIQGEKLYAKVWDSSNHDEPEGWTLAEEDESLTTGSGVGIAARRDTGNTNANLEVQYNSFQAVPGWIRSCYEISSYRDRWDNTGNDLTMLIQGAGIRRRLSQNDRPLQSPLYRAYTQSNPVAYWPMEDGIDAQFAASGLSDGTPLTIQTGLIDFITEGPKGSVGAANMGFTASGAVTAVLPPIAAGSAWQVAMWVKGAPGDTTYNEIFVLEVPTKFGSSPLWKMLLSSPQLGFPNQTIQFAYYDSSGSFVDGLAYLPVDYPGIFDGEWHLIQVTLRQNGADIDATIFYDGSSVATDSFAGQTLGAPVRITSLSSRAGGTDVFEYIHVCHYGVWDTATVVSNLIFAGSAWDDELAGVRFARLCDEEGIAYEIVGSSADTQQMGPQRIDTLLANLEDIEQADLGVLYEPRHFFGLAYRTRNSIYLPNQDALTLDYTSAHLSDALENDDDDSFIRNDVVATRPNGSSVRAIQEVGPNNVQDPADDPQGVGRYEIALTPNVYADTQLASIVNWIKAQGTYDEQARFPSVSVSLHRSVFISDAVLTSTIAGRDIADYLIVENPLSPPLPPEDLKFIIRGYTETFQNFRWKIKWNTTPAGPYNVFVVGTSRLATSGTVLANAETSTSTAMEFQATGQSLWTTTEEPFDVMIAGETIAVTASNDATSPQDMTVTRSVNGVVKAQLAGAEIQIVNPPRLAM